MSAYDKQTGLTLHHPKGCPTPAFEVLETIRTKQYGRMGLRGFVIADYAKKSTPAQLETLNKLLTHYRRT